MPSTKYVKSNQQKYSQVLCKELIQNRKVFLEIAKNVIIALSQNAWVKCRRIFYYIKLFLITKCKLKRVSDKNIRGHNLISDHRDFNSVNFTSH